MHPVFGATQRDMQQTPFFGAGGRCGRPRDRHQPSLETGHEYDLPLETLRAVEGHEVAPAIARRVTAGREVEPRDEAGDRTGTLLRRQVVAAELEQGVAVGAKLVVGAGVSW